MSDGQILDLVKPHLSDSQLRMLMRCPQQYEFRYKYGLRAPPAVAMVVGTGTHGGIEADLKNKIATGELLPTEAVKDAARDAFAAAWEKETPVAVEGDPSMGEAVDQAVSLAALYHGVIAPSLNPVGVEISSRLVLDGFPWDIELRKDVETDTHIRDTKTMGKAPTQDAADRSEQLTLYSLDAAVNGHDKAVALDCLVKTKVPKAITVTSTRTADDHARFLRRVEVSARMIESGIFPPTNPDNWWCSKKWCGYWDRCDFGGKKSVTVGLIDRSRLTSRVRT